MSKEDLRNEVVQAMTQSIGHMPDEYWCGEIDKVVENEPEEDE